jgi:hypothetical protein
MRSKCDATNTNCRRSVRRAGWLTRKATGMAPTGSSGGPRVDPFIHPMASCFAGDFLALFFLGTGSAERTGDEVLIWWGWPGGGETFARFLPHTPSSNALASSSTSHARLVRNLGSVSVSPATVFHRQSAPNLYA